MSTPQGKQHNSFIFDSLNNMSSFLGVTYRRSNVATNSFSIPLIKLPRCYSDRHRDISSPIVGSSGSTPLHFIDANGHTNVHYY